MARVPYGDLTFSSDGTTLYGVTSSSGPTGSGSVFSVATRGGSLTYLHFFSGDSSAGAFPVGELALSKDGSTLYGFTLQGGPSNLGAVFSIPTSGGSPTYLHFFTGSSTDGATSYGTVISGADSTLYGMTSAGGPDNYGTAFSIPMSGGSPTYLHFFTGGSTDGAQPHGNLLLSADGFTFYRITVNGGPTNFGTLFSIPK